MQLLVDCLAERLQRPVGVDDRRFRAIAYSSHLNEIDSVRRDSILGRQAPAAVIDWLEELGVLSARRYLRIPANAKLQMVARICFPLRFHGRLLGFLWLLESVEPFDVDALADCERVAADLGEELYRLHQQERDERQQEASRVDRLLSGSGKVADGLVHGGVYAVLALGVRLTGAIHLQGLDVRLTEAVDRSRRASQPHHQLARISPDRAAVVVACASERELEARAEALLVAAQRAFDDLPATEPILGLSAPVMLAQLPTAGQEAELALALGATIPAMGPLVRWRELGTLGLVVQLLGDRDPGSLVPEPIHRMLAASDGEMLLTTLEAYLDHAGDAADTAAELYLHRSSLYKRLHRIERLAGVSLRSGRDRLDLHVGLLLWRLSGAGDAVHDVAAVGVSYRIQ